MAAFSTGYGEARMPAVSLPSQFTTPASATHNLDSSLVDAIHDSSPVDAVTDVDVVAIVADGAQPPEISELEEEDGEQLDEAEGTNFVRSLGAWSKPLHFTPPPTPPEPATPRLGVSEAVMCQIDSFWPTIGEAIICTSTATTTGKNNSTSGS